MVNLIDTTLREGEQTPGVSFDLCQKKQIVQGLVDTGVTEVELGIAVVGDQALADLARWATTCYPQHSFSIWSRCCPVHIRVAQALGPTIIALSIPVSDLHLYQKIRKNRNWARETLHQSIVLARSLGAGKIAVGFEDATRADPDFIKEMAEIARKAGAFRLRLADTVGVATPKRLCTLIDRLGGIGLEIGVHCHNDFGMATANSIASLEHGAIWADVTVLGLGERAGNSRLEEVVGFYSLQKGEEQFDLRAMRRLSGLLAKVTNRFLSPSRPILGVDIFTCETGLHLQGLLIDPTTYEPYDPDLVGGTRRLLIGQKVGQHAVGQALCRRGIALPGKQRLLALTHRVRLLATQKKTKPE